MSKYHSKKITLNGITYDSKKEAKRHQELLLLERAGAIQSLQTQVKYVLIPAQREPDKVGKRGGTIKGKLIERECAYIADFTYIENGQTVVEDVKGYRNPGSAGLAKYIIKRKLMLYVHGIRIREI